MIKTKLQITIDIAQEYRPTQEELKAIGFESELEYWIDFLYSDPPEMLDGATFELVGYDL